LVSQRLPPSDKVLGWARYAEWLWSEDSGGDSPQASFDAVKDLSTYDPFWDLAIAPIRLGYQPTGTSTWGSACLGTAGSRGGPWHTFPDGLFCRAWAKF
jgi:hypothetical protein